MTTFEQQLQESLSHAYEIERELGGGGMSRVFVATERSLGRKVVIKLLSPELTAEVNRGRFRREIQVAAQLQHPHIVTLLSAGEYGDLVYYTMPFIRGESLKSAIETDGAMAIKDVVRILYDVVDALAYAHENGVIHRDIKPANILRSGAHSLVTDFGVSKALNAAMQSGGGITSTGMAIGTPAYMAPEQLAGDPAADHRIDIYALGLLAYELLTGKSPFAASSPRGMLAAVLTQEPRPLVDVRSDVPRALSEMVMACLSKEPDGRPASAGLLLGSLDLFSTSSGEIRTREYRVPVNRRATPTVPASSLGTRAGDTSLSGSPAVSGSFAAGSSAVSGSAGPTDSFGAAGTFPVSGNPPAPVMASAGTILVPTMPVEANAAPGLPLTDEAVRPKSGRNKLLVGGLAVLVPVVAGAIFFSQRSREKPPAPIPPAVVAPATVVPAASAPVTDSASPQQALPQQAPAQTPVQPLPGAPLPGTGAAVTQVLDPKAIADSAKARAAKADAAKKAAAARGDSIRTKTEQQIRIGVAKRAAAAMLSNAEASKAFQRGASRTGGLLGIQKKGDLQTQIDAIRPFLTSAGLTYDQFKAILNEAGVNIFDEFGRMVPETLQHFATSPN
ncbi:MAG: protein kinase [Gemmatimonadales bacterium]